MNPEQILESLVKRVIVPKYPFLSLYKIDSYSLTNLVEFDVRFITRKKLDETLQMDIDTEVKNLFRMAGLDDIEKRVRNKVAVWFKAPNGKSWVFKSKPGYEHI